MVFPGYGISEATISVTTKPFLGVLGGRVRNVPGSAGILLPGMEARILREDGSAASPNETGELWLRSGSIALGYWNDKKATRKTFVDGWLKTGDLFVVDKDGTFYFQDRIKVNVALKPMVTHCSTRLMNVSRKDTLKISGMQVSPTELENVLLAHPGSLIVDATVVGVKGGRTLDEKVPRAWVVLSKAGAKKGKEVVVNSLDAWSRKNLSKYKRLRGGIEVVSAVCLLSNWLNHANV